MDPSLGSSENLYHFQASFIGGSCERKNTQLQGDIKCWLSFLETHIMKPCFTRVLDTLQGINISYLGKRKFIFKSALLWDMLVPRRVHINIINTSHVFMSCVRFCQQKKISSIESGSGLPKFLSIQNHPCPKFLVFIKGAFSWHEYEC